MFSLSISLCVSLSLIVSHCVSLCLIVSHCVSMCVSLYIAQAHCGGRRLACRYPKLMAGVKACDIGEHVDARTSQVQRTLFSSWSLLSGMFPETPRCYRILLLQAFCRYLHSLRVSLAPPFALCVFLYHCLSLFACFCITAFRSFRVSLSSLSTCVSSAFRSWASVLRCMSLSLSLSSLSKALCGLTLITQIL